MTFGRARFSAGNSLFTIPSRRCSCSVVAPLFRKGVAENEIAQVFPGLSSRDLAYARLFSRLGERPGTNESGWRFNTHPSDQFFSFLSVGDFANCANPSRADFASPAYGPFGSN